MDTCRVVSQRDIFDGGGGLGGWEEATLRVCDVSSSSASSLGLSVMEGSGERELGGAAAVVGGRGGLRLGQMVMPCRPLISRGLTSTPHTHKQRVP